MDMLKKDLEMPLDISANSDTFLTDRSVKPHHKRLSMIILVSGFIIVAIILSVLAWGLYFSEMNHYETKQHLSNATTDHEIMRKTINDLMEMKKDLIEKNNNLTNAVDELRQVNKGLLIKVKELTVSSQHFRMVNSNLTRVNDKLIQDNADLKLKLDRAHVSNQYQQQNFQNGASHLSHQYGFYLLFLFQIFI